MTGTAGSPEGIQDPEDERWQRRVRRQNFLGYYNRELSYLRQLGADFKNNHPIVASRLKLDENTCDDPHVERLLESFAFLAARIHNRIDDEFPEITAALLEELYPNFTRPVPSVSLVELQTDPERGKQTAGRKLERGTPLHSNPSEGFVCKFRTCYDTELWPLTVDGARWRSGSDLPPALIQQPTAAFLELRLSCSPDVTFPADLKKLRSLRFYLNGGNDIDYPLYELLLTRCHTVLVQDGGGKDTAGKDASAKEGAQISTGKPFNASLSPAGFGENEVLCWDARNRRGFLGYQLLEDYFTFPRKFLFFDLNGLEPLATSGIVRQVSVLFLISQYPPERPEWRSILEQGVSPRTFRLNCTPIVNLFSTTSRQIPVRTNVFELPVDVDSRSEIYSIDDVYGLVRASAERTLFDRYVDCGNEEAGRDIAGYWNAVRRPSRTEENLSEMCLTLLDRRGVQVDPRADTLTAKVTCTNRDWPSRLPMNHPTGDFHIDAHPEIKVVCLRAPSKGSPAPSGRTSLWRLVSQLSLNHLSLVEQGRNALQCILRVHNLVVPEDFGEEHISGIDAVTSKPHFARVSSEHGMAFVRGKLVELTLDEQRFAGSGAFLFASVLERFLGLYTSLNSFSQLSLKARQRGEKNIHTWPPRAGSRVVV